MTTLHWIDLRCPVCESTFETMAASSNGENGHYYIDPSAPASVAAAVLELAPQLGTSVRIPWLALTVAGSDKYDGAARIAEWRGDDARRVGELWIRAAWCCLDEDDVEAERYYACHAARWFAKALDVYGEIDGEERASMAYQLGELWLRIGDAKQASTWFERVADEIVDPDGQRMILEAAQLQAQRAGRTS